MISQKSLLVGLVGLVFAGIGVSAGDCIVEHTDDGSDDSPSILKAFQDCAIDSTITFTQANYSAYTPVSLTGLQNVTVFLNGNLLLPSNVTRVQHEINITQNQPSTYATPWFYIQGSDVQIIGSDEPQWGGFHSFGQQWWDVGNRILRPQLATFNVSGGLLRGLKVIKPIAWGWNIPGQNILIEDHFVDAKPDNGTRDDTISFPFNTDGFNLSGHNITVDGYYGHNGDDCVSVINGAHHIVAKNGYCGFSSHGLSIGSLGRDGAVHSVKHVLFKNWTMDGAVYGARYKSWTGGQGLVEDITWEDITLVNVSTGIFVTQNYYDQDKGPRPENVNKTSTKIEGLHFKNIKGLLGDNWTDGTCITEPCWNYVEGGDTPHAVILDLFPGTATNITLVDIDIHKGNHDTATVICDPTSLADGEQATLGFECASGPFKATAIEDKPNGALRTMAGTGIVGALAFVVLALF